MTGAAQELSGEEGGGTDESVHYHPLGWDPHWAETDNKHGGKHSRSGSDKSSEEQNNPEC